MQACSGTERAYNPRDGRWTQTLILTQIMMMMMVLGCARSDAVDQRRGSRGVEACDSCGDDNNVVAVLDLTTAKVQFDGVGGTSGGGGGSRLLLDYDAGVRSDILDLLFKPAWGAALHTLKVEIGCDGDTTQGAEPSHMHTSDDNSTSAFDRGYETWLMTEARLRNPDIHLSGLEWGVPGWVVDPGVQQSVGYWSRNNTEYIISWLRGLRDRKGLVVDSVSLGRNEAGYNTTWIKATRSAMTDAGFGHVKVIAADDHRGGTPPLVAAMTTDRELRDAIDIIGVHTMGRINGVTVDNQSKAQMAAMHKPFWNTEQHFGIPDPNAHSCREWATAAQLAITLNRLYIQENMTSVLLWTPIYSWYEWLWFSGKGILVANTPWSGHYEASNTIWVVAHTTQFVQPGWRYFGGSGSGMLCANHTCAMQCFCGTHGCQGAVCGSGSYVSYSSPDGRDVSIVVETMWSLNSSTAGTLAPYEAQTITFQLAAFAANITTMHVWVTNETHHFVQEPSISVAVGGVLTVAVPPNTLFTLTTTTGQRKGTESSSVPVPPPRKFSSLLPLSFDFGNEALDTPPRFFADMQGAFAVAEESVSAGSTAEEGVIARFAEESTNAMTRDERSTNTTRAGARNRVMRQFAPVPPTALEGCGSTAATAIGDVSWSYYTVSTRARTIETEGDLYLTSHAGSGDDGQQGAPGLQPSDLCGGFGYRLTVTCRAATTRSNRDVGGEPVAVRAKTGVGHVGAMIAKPSVPDGPAQACEANQSGVTCGGTAHDLEGDHSADACASRCCADPSCAEWHWKPSTTTTTTTASVAGGCWRGRCLVPPSPMPGWIGGTRGGSVGPPPPPPPPGPPVAWMLTAKAATHPTVVLAQGGDVACRPGEWINMTLAVDLVDGLNMATVWVQGRMLASVKAPTWGYTYGAASFGGTLNLMEFDDVTINASHAH